VDVQVLTQVGSGSACLLYPRLHATCVNKPHATHECINMTCVHVDLQHCNSQAFNAGLLAAVQGRTFLFVFLLLAS
jgi:hypothetical protein